MCVCVYVFSILHMSPRTMLVLPKHQLMSGSFGRIFSEVLGRLTGGGGGMERSSSSALVSESVSLLVGGGGGGRARLLVRSG